MGEPKISLVTGRSQNGFRQKVRFGRSQYGLSKDQLGLVGSLGVSEGKITEWVRQGSTKVRSQNVFAKDQ